MLLQDGRKPLDLALLILRLLRGEWAITLALHQFAGARFIRFGRGGQVKAMNGLAAAPVDRETIGKASILDAVEGVEHPAQGVLMRFGGRHATDAPAFLLRGVTLQNAKARHFRADGQCARIGPETGVPKLAQGPLYGVGVPHGAFH